MLNQEKILELFDALNKALAENGERGEVGIIGGAAMCLVFDARASTKDVGAIFKPVSVIRRLAARIAEEHGVESDWLIDAAKGYIEGTFDRSSVWSGSHLTVWAPEPRYLLAMKCLSGRWDSMDRKDVKFLIHLLKIKKAKDVFKIIETFFPKNRILPKTQYFIDELFEASRA